MHTHLGDAADDAAERRFAILIVHHERVPKVDKDRSGQTPHLSVDEAVQPYTTTSHVTLVNGDSRALYCRHDDGIPDRRRHHLTLGVLALATATVVIQALDLRTGGAVGQDDHLRARRMTGAAQAQIQG